MKKQYHVVAEGFDTIRIGSYNPYLLPVSKSDDDFLKVFIKGVSKNEDMVGVNLPSISLDDKTLRFDTRRISYAQHASLLRSNPSSLVQALYVAGLVLTSDERLVFGLTQATENQFMNKFGVPAGGVSLSPDGFPSLGAALYRELGEELGLVPEVQVENIIPGWITGASKRENNYHLSAVFLVPLRMTSKELCDFFDEWKNQYVVLTGEKSEFAYLNFVPNSPTELKEWLAGCTVLGKSKDIVDEWVNSYGCSPDNLKSRPSGLFLPQPTIDSLL